MSRKRRIVNRNPVLPSEEAKCCLLGQFGGPHHRYIAKRLYGEGKPNYTPTDAEIRRVSGILKRNNISTRDWRNGDTEESQNFFGRLARMSLNRIEQTAKTKRLPFRIVA